MEKKIKNKKIILITGVSGGIGKAIVLHLLSRNDVYVIGLGRTDPIIQQDNFQFINLDLFKSESIQNVAEMMKEINIDVFINNAGSGFRGTVEELSIEKIREQFEVNFFSPVLLLQKLLPNLIANKGLIVNIGALGSIIETPTMGYYSVSKLAYSKLLDILKIETGLKICNIYLGAVKSNFGKNIQDGVDIEKSKYKELYYEWQNRFRNFFLKRNKAEDVAILIERAIFGNNNEEFVSKRDRIIAYSKRFLPNSIYKKIINYYYRYES